jgi:2-iminobutanoate/2-iminopropanoate deaminase
MTLDRASATNRRQTRMVLDAIGVALHCCHVVREGVMTMTRDAIATGKLAAPVGPFSLGVQGAGLLFLSGQVAQDPVTGTLIDGDVARQTTRSWRTSRRPGNGRQVLEDVPRVGVYLTDISDFAVMSHAYSEHFTEPPARTAIGVAVLPLGAAVEMDVVVG